MPSFGMMCSNSQLTSAHPFLSLFIFFCHRHHMECFLFSVLRIFLLSFPLCAWFPSTPFLSFIFYILYSIFYIYYILIIMTSPFYSRTLLFNTSPLPLPIQVVNAISIFGNDKKVYLQSKGRMPTANWPLQSFSYFYLVIVLLPVNIVNLVRRTHIRGDRQFSMFMSENIRTWLTFLTMQLQRGQDNHCGNEVGR